MVVFEMCASKNGVAAREIERKYRLTAKTARFMLHRIREAMRREPLVGLLRGTGVADETWIGGNPEPPCQQAHKSRSRVHRQAARDDLGGLRNPRSPIPRRGRRVTGATLAQVMEEELDMPRTMLWTDGSASYRTVGERMSSHHTVDHSIGEYKRNGVGTNLAEGFFAQLKRSVDGTHHHVSREHLDRYLTQFDWMYSYCKATDTARMRRLIDQVDGRRLSYKPLTNSE